MSNQRSRLNPSSLTRKPRLSITGFYDSLPRYSITSHIFLAIIQTGPTTLSAASKLSRNSPRHLRLSRPFPVPLLRNNLHTRLDDKDVSVVMRLATTLKTVAPKTRLPSRKGLRTIRRLESYSIEIRPLWVLVPRCHHPTLLFISPLMVLRLIFTAINYIITNRLLRTRLSQH